MDTRVDGALDNVLVTFITDENVSLLSVPPYSTSPSTTRSAVCCSVPVTVTNSPLVCVQQLLTCNAFPSHVLDCNTVWDPTQSWLSMVTLLTWQQVHDVVEQVVQLEVGQDIV